MKNIFFVGINGIGMSGLAQIMKTLNYNVSGSDLSNSYLSEKMKNQGINIYSKHDSKNIDNIDTLIVSTAIGENNPEYKRAKENNLTIIKRGELLANLLNEKIGIAVAGTHGKTTTSSMLSSVLLEKDPTIVVGGIIPEISSNARCGKSDLFVAEADESDNSFLFMKPKYSIITNIEADHLEKHGCLNNIIHSFNTFVSQTSEEIIICEDCPNCNDIIKNHSVKTYSLINKKAFLFADNIRVYGKKTFFDVYINEEYLGEFILSIPGKHNVYNSLPVIYLGLKFGVSKENIKKSISNFTGAKRRYDILLDKENVKVIDDYGHHPTEIRATLEGAKSIENKEITVIFQPHRFSRIKFLLDQFEGAFDKADELILLPVYSAGEKDEFGVTIENLFEKIKHPNSRIVFSESELEKDILSKNIPRTYIFMGAGNISTFAHSIAEKLK
ncbi:MULTISPECIES: UDP-N-acetylmuramate--L-alanine ligase [Fusobacterium]|uniref:UDP-N-acetylmuramate--L-alanine ligase n=1 Tax=Fusobacterium TaxID=848 RepID=UPI00147696A7|nr:MULTISPECIES: UDP-N-acetylmuramate--L-alanine ligase [Fusobacterium]NME36000.1 UDP-N-acetylmuramate--L-alanine ligase [Fusobacterium sp. FSA-380-WT-3A]